MGMTWGTHDAPHCGEGSSAWGCSKAQGIPPTDPVVGRGPVLGDVLGHREYPQQNHCGERISALGCHGAQRAGNL